MSDNYTIKEAARVYELNINTLYKYIQQGKINAQYYTIKGKKIKKITKLDIEQFLGINCKVKSNDMQQDTILDNQQNTIKSNGFNQNPITDNLITKDNLKEVFKDFIEEQKAEWIKPLEEHALVKYGALSTENKFLKDRLETVIEENNFLQEAMKALPGPVKEIKKITKLDIEQFLGINCKVKSNDMQQDTILDNQQNTIKSNGFNQNPITDNLITKDNLKEVFKDFIEEQKAEWIKPLEEHALVKYGALSTENKFLKDRLETVIEENNFLQEAMKALPGPVKEIKEKLQQHEAVIKNLQTEIELKEKEKEIAIEVITEETAQAIHAVEKEQAQVITEKEITLKEKEQVIQEKETILKVQETALKEKEQTLQQIQKEKEHLQQTHTEQMGELEEQLKEQQAKKDQKLQELKEQNERAEKEEKDLLATIQALKERVQAEEKKPWWKKLIGG